MNEEVAAAGETRTVAALLGELTAALAPGVPRAGYADAIQEARELLAALLDVPRFWPAQHRSDPVDEALRELALAAARRRASGAPLAYAVRRANFRHLTLDVDERVLIPRPETEQLVDLVLALVGPGHGGVAIDVGTGSGAIALALACEGPFDRVMATDLSRDALEVAAHNAEVACGAVHAPVSFHHGSLLDPVRDVGARCVVSNPPYIAHAEAASLPAGVRDWEPPLALYSGQDGLATTARLVRQAADVLESGGVLALEVDARRASLVAERIAADGRYDSVAVTLDLFGRERFVSARRR
jgi:release factor glutamine methyltransferase